MDKEQQIEEMTKTLRNKRVEQGFMAFDCKIPCDKCWSKRFHCVEREYATTLYDAGYRKAEEVRKDTAKEIINWVYKMQQAYYKDEAILGHLMEKYGVEVKNEIREINGKSIR